ncbi:MAG: hypothetical protein JNL45_05010 [Hyphomicrobium sp.]|nr:hypothetical protein [Hyphomicrobium sp.]
MRSLKCNVVLVFGAFCLVPPAHAQEAQSNPSLSKTWVVDAGVAYRRLDGDLSAITSGGKGGGYDFGRLGLDDHDTSVSADLHWRISKAWRLDLGYDGISTKGLIDNHASLDFGRITIPTGYELSSSLDVQTYSAFLGYTFTQSHDFELGGRLGLNVIDANASVSGRAFAGNKEVSAGPEYVSKTTLVPTLGLYATYAFDDRLAFEGSIDGIAGSLGSNSGHYVQMSAGLKYWLTDSFALGAGYSYLSNKIEHDGSTIDSGLEVRSHTGYLKASLGF